MSSNAFKVHFPGVLEFLGWHGTFVIGSIIIFEVLLPSGASACPCTGHVVYGTAMLLLPAISIFLVAFFSYFYRDDTQSPWRDLQAYYKYKRPCPYSPRSRNWEMHSGVFHQCTECQGKWHKIKIAISFFVSLVYSILWLALLFRQLTYYACAHVGPDPNGILQYCDNWKAEQQKKEYIKKYLLAVSKSLLVGNVLLVVVIVLTSALFITYRLISSKIADSDDEEIQDNYDRERLPQASPNNFGYGNEAVVIPGSQGQRTSPMTRSTEGPSPGYGRSHEGFRERPGDTSRERVSPRDTEQLIKVDA